MCSGRIYSYRLFIHVGQLFITQGWISIWDSKCDPDIDALFDHLQAALCKTLDLKTLKSLQESMADPVESFECTTPQGLAWACASWLGFCCCWEDSTLCQMSGFNKSLMFRPSSNWAGEIPVVLCFTISKQQFCESGSFKWSCFRTWTALSVSPLEAGWYGADLRCEIPFLAKNSSNSPLVKQVLLSVTSVSGMPNWRDTVFSCWIVTFVVAELTGKAFGMSVNTQTNERARASSLIFQGVHHVIHGEVDDDNILEPPPIGYSHQLTRVHISCSKMVQCCRAREQTFDFLYTRVFSEDTTMYSVHLCCFM